MHLSLLCLVSAATAFPASVLYDRRQDGDLNVSADVSNVVILVAVPEKMSVPLDLFDGFLKNNKGQTRHSEAQERADHVMDAFVEPNTPYQVEIGSDRSAEGGGRAVEVVIAARRRLDSDQQDESSEEIKLLGARENCGPDRERDPVTLTCRFKLDSAEDNSLPQTSSPVTEAPQLTPEVVSS